MSAAPWQVRDGVWRIALRVQPRSRRPGLGGVQGGRLRARVAEPASDGAANAALIALLSRVLAVPQNDITMRAGATGRDKTVRVTSARDLEPRLAALAASPT